MRSRNGSVEPELLSHVSSVTIKVSDLTTNGYIILEAESESIIQIKNTSMRNSTTHTARDDHPSALVHISSGRSRLLIENSANLENKGERIVYMLDNAKST